nr:phosphatase [Parachlamydiaceae bacterium]
ASQHPVIGRPHIAKLMVQKGYVKDIREAFNKFIGEGRSCYAKGNFFTPEETIDVIQKAKGFAIIAHPHLINNSKTISKLLHMNFDGLECYYSRFPLAAQKPWIKIATQKNWLMTGGSDFHGDIKPMVSLGCSWVDEARFNILQNRFIENETFKSE